LPIFLVSSPFTDEQDSRPGIPRAEDQTSPLFAQPAAGAIPNFNLQLGESTFRIDDSDGSALSGKTVRGGSRAAGPDRLRPRHRHDSGLLEEQDSLPQLRQKLCAWRGGHRAACPSDSRRSRSRAATSRLVSRGNASWDPSAPRSTTRLVGEPKPASGSSTRLATTRSSSFSCSFLRADSR